MNKTLILYSYYENGKNAIENFRFFLRRALKRNEKYSFYVNINGNTVIDLDFYLKKYSNLKVIYSKGICAWDGWKNIIDMVDISKYEHYIFMKDIVLGPLNTKCTGGVFDKKGLDWIEGITENIKKNQEVIISYYGAPILDKLYILPYVPVKFFCVSKNVLNDMKKYDVFSKLSYNSSLQLRLRYKQGKKKYKLMKIKGWSIDELKLMLDGSEDKSSNIRYIDENISGDVKYLKKVSSDIGFTHFLLESNYNYVSYDRRGITNLNILKYYKKRNYKKLSNIVRELYINLPKIIEHLIFWTNIPSKIVSRGGRIKLFELEDESLGRKDIGEMENW
tara:strand:- start:323 stop:1324 length:1002 start_codon:yes stop_codon:yes gene_type:complete